MTFSMRRTTPTIAIVGLVSLSFLAACSGDGGGSASSDSATVSSAVASDAGAASSAGADASTAPASTATTTRVQLETTDAPPDADATAGVVQTAVSMRALAAAVSSGEANDKAFKELFDAWNGYHETIKASDPADWQTMNDALDSMKDAISNKDGDAANAASAAFESAVNGFLAKS
jgi:hypothetical protein